MTTSSEPRLKTFWRWVLQAYWKHQEIQPPCEFMLTLGHVVQERESPDEVTPPVYAKDAIIIRTELRIGFLDILRCALGCRMQCNAVVYCENPPGKIHTETIAFPVL